MKTVLDKRGIQQALDAMAKELGERTADAPLAVVGIRRGGEFLGKRLVALLSAGAQAKVPFGVVDITLYRDDGYGRRDWPEVGPTDIPFELSSHTVVLVDDVLYTGRTVRAALDAILDYGRPKAVRLAVLVDRGLRELPIRADAVGLALRTTASEHVDVLLTEAGAPDDAVVLGPTPKPEPKDAAKQGGRG